jgi:3-oxoacyl-[acyl-carrier protein] reductase
MPDTTPGTNQDGRRTEYDMSDDVAVVTGGTRGIGRRVAQRLAANGATTIVTYRHDEDDARDARDALAPYDATTAVRQFDVGDYDAVQTTFDDIEDEYGSISILVNNAGTMRNSLLLRMDPEEWESVISTNLTGTFNCTQRAVRSMLVGDGGRIVNVSSVGGCRGWAGQSNYAASKAGIIGFTRSVARELGGRSIRVNAIAPGYTDTDLADELDGDDDITAHEDIPAGRVAEPDEIAAGIEFLVSEQSSYVNGEVLRVDGGLLS